MAKREEFRYEDPRDAENVVRVHECECGAIALSVADEQAVDSYNSTFECTIHLNRKVATKLRDYLTKILTTPQPVTENHRDGYHW